MDQFIGKPSFWNRGIGSQLVRETVQCLLEVKQASKIVMDPQCWNQRALHVYEKNGFRRKKLLPRHEWHEGELRDCWLIEYLGTGE
ncbi:Bifunctional AAC/APH [compost metagenome]